MMHHRRLLIVGFIFLLLLVIGGISLINQSDNSERLICIGYMPIAECAPLFYRKPFDARNLELRLSQSSGGSLILDGVVAGTYDIGFSNLVTPLFARGNDIDLVSIAGATFEDRDHSLHELVVKADSGIAVARDLENRTIALNTRRNIDHLLARRWLRLNGVDPEKVSFKEVPFPQMIDLLAGGGVDAIAVVEPFKTQAIQRGMKSIGNYFLSGGVEEVQITSYIGQKTWAIENPKLAQDFKDALTESIETLNNNDELYRSLVKELTGRTDRVISEIDLPGLRYYPEPVGVKAIYDWLIEEGFLSHTFNPLELLELHDGFTD